MIRPSVIQYICEYVRQRSAIILDAEKDYLIETRLMPVLQRRKLGSLDDLVDALRKGQTLGLEAEVIEAMTTNETFFFRDEVPFATLREKVLPNMIEARKSVRELRIWCAAASTGQEPYSIAMVIAEHFPALLSWDLQFMATDINDTVLNKARSGTFKDHEVNRGLDPKLRDRYFHRDGSTWVIQRSLRDLIQFSTLNLIDTWRWDRPFDIVFMRNVLIYFDVQTKQQILRRVRQSMRSDGALFLGGAETTVNIDDAYKCEREGRSVFYRLAA